MNQPKPTLLSEFIIMGMDVHASHSQLGTSFRKFVEGNREKLKDDWSKCRHLFCKARYELAYPEETKTETFKLP